MERKKAVILLSGGIDSTTILAIAKSEGFEIYTLSFNYGQRHVVELLASKKISEIFGAAKHLILNLDLRKIGKSALTDEIEVPKSRNESEISKDIPVTYVPARNTIFLSYALSYAESIDASDIFIGVNSTDYSGYPDCRPEYIKAFEIMANLATKASVTGKIKFNIRTPLMYLTKAQIIEKGYSLGVDFSITHSCYDPSLSDNSSCGYCDSCILRKKGFKEAGIKDPTIYY